MLACKDKYEHTTVFEQMCKVSPFNQAGLLLKACSNNVMLAEHLTPEIVKEF